MIGRRSAPAPRTLSDEELGPQAHFLGKDRVPSQQDHTMVRIAARIMKAGYTMGALACTS